MSSAEKSEWTSVEAYLKTEAAAETRNEYVDGWVRAMTGATNRHNIVTVNTLVTFANLLQGKLCQPYNSEAKIWIKRGRSSWFYYPDVTVVCKPNPQTDCYLEWPVLVVEVLSRSTRAIDLDEKLNNYLTLPSLEYCLFLEQAKPHAILLRRMEQGFLRETYEGLDAILPLEKIECQVPLGDLYSRVDFSPDAVREELAAYTQ